MDLLNKKPTFDGGPAKSIPNLDPDTAHRLDPLAERFAFIPLSGKIPLIKGWPKSKGYSIEELLNYKNCTIRESSDCLVSRQEKETSINF